MQLPDGTLVLATDGYGVIFYKNNEITKQISKAFGLASNICKKLFVKNERAHHRSSERHWFLLLGKRMRFLQRSKCNRRIIVGKSGFLGF